MERLPYVGVIGAGSCSDTVYELAREVGHEVETVGILPGLDRALANPFITVAIPTGLGEARNVMVVRASDVLVAIAGGYGTLSEIGLALKTGKRVIGLETWQDIQGIEYVSTPAEAIQRIIEHKKI